MNDLTQPITREYGDGIVCIDAAFQRVGMASCYLMVEAGRCALIDTGTCHTVPLIEQAMADRGLEPEDMAFIIPTHVHLDHAGGVGALMRRMPNARLIVHPRGARHMIDPAKLRAGVIAVYGEEVFERDYVELLPVDKERVIAAEDGHVESLAGRRLTFIDTPGHANHHLCVWDERSRGFFTGDTFGLSYREFDSAKGAFVLPATTPVQFNPEAWHGSLDRMMAFGPERMFLTHYGQVTEVERLTRDLRAGIDAMARIARENEDLDHRGPAIAATIRAHFMTGLKAHGVTLADEEMLALIQMDVQLNTQGLEVWLDRQKQDIVRRR